MINRILDRHAPTKLSLKEWIGYEVGVSLLMFDVKGALTYHTQNSTKKKNDMFGLISVTSDFSPDMSKEKQWKIIHCHKHRKITFFSNGAK